MRSKTHGAILVASAFAAWGILPAYWRLLANVRPEVILFHRILWSVVFFGFLLLVRGKLGASIRGFTQPRILLPAAGAALSLAINWYTYIWAMINNELVASGLGYIICPVLTVLLASWICKEPLLRRHQAALLLMFAGIALRALALGRFPSIALVLAGSFASYSLLRKRTGAEPAAGLLFECLLLLVPAAALLQARGCLNNEVLWGSGARECALLLFSGVVTALPLLLLAQGVHAVSLMFVGIAQYLAPTLTLALAVFVYGEQLARADYVSFPLLWCGVLVFLFDGAGWRAVKRCFAMRPETPGLPDGTNNIVKAAG